MLVNEAYFLNTCNHIPNLVGCVKEEGFNSFMKQNAKASLYKTLGNCLADEILSYTDPDTCLLDKDNPSLPEHLKWLVFGHEYEPLNKCRCQTTCNCVSVGNCTTIKWKGIIDEDNRQSYLADYVYYSWMCKRKSICCDSKDNHEEIKKQMRIDAYNNFVGWVCECDACSVSLYGFLRDFKELFPTHEGECFRYKNYWGI